jgi:hypothetical protein
MDRNLSFRKFLEDQKPSPMNHLDALSGELGINIDDLEKIPQVLANFQVGGKVHSLSGYQIVDLIRDDKGDVSAAKIKLINDPHHAAHKLFGKSKTSKKWSRIPDCSDEETYTVSLDKLNKMLTQGMEGGGGGMPGGGGMGGLPGMI